MTIILLIVLLIHLVVLNESIPNVRVGNSGNCVGTKSCRPRCISFSIHRSIISDGHCLSMSGIFASTNKTRNIAWDLKRSGVSSCIECIQEDECGWFDDLTVRVTEQGSYWTMTTDLLLPIHGDDRFTFCSIYPCSKTECALPEQMGSTLSFEVSSVYEPVIKLLSLHVALSKEFEGEIRNTSEHDRIGPLQFDWMDDPTGCRAGLYTSEAPVLPNLDPVVSVIAIHSPIKATSDLFCFGTEYDPAPLNGTRKRRQTLPGTIILNFWFPDRKSLYSEREIRGWKSLTLTYMRLKGLAVENITVLEQSLSTGPPSGVFVAQVFTKRRVERDGTASANPVHMMQAAVRGYNLGQAAEIILSSSWENYTNFLMKGMSQYMNQNQGSLSGGPSTWQLIALIVGISMIVFTVVVSIHDKIRRRTATDSPPVIATSSKASSSGISEESETGWSVPDYRHGCDMSPG